MKKEPKNGLAYTRKITGTANAERLKWRSNKRLAANRAFEAVDNARRL